MEIVFGDIALEPGGSELLGTDHNGVWSWVPFDVTSPHNYKVPEAAGFGVPAIQKHEGGADSVRPRSA